MWAPTGSTDTTDSTGSTGRRAPETPRAQKGIYLCQPTRSRAQNGTYLCPATPKNTSRAHTTHKTCPPSSRWAQIRYQMCQNRYLPNPPPNVPTPLPTKSATKCAKTAPAAPLLKRHYLAHYFFDLRALFIERLKSRSSNIKLYIYPGSAFNFFFNHISHK